MFKTGDVNGEPVEVTMMLYFHKMIGYTDPTSFISQKFKYTINLYFQNEFKRNNQ